MLVVVVVVLVVGVVVVVVATCHVSTLPARTQQDNKILSQSQREN